MRGRTRCRAESGADAVGALGRAPDHPRCDDDGSAGVRLLRVSTAVLRTAVSGTRRSGSGRADSQDARIRSTGDGRTGSRTRSRRLRPSRGDVPAGGRARSAGFAAEHGAEGAVRDGSEARAAARRRRAHRRQRIPDPQPARDGFRSRRADAGMGVGVRCMGEGRARAEGCGRVARLPASARPGVRLALPTPEHFVPVLVALGAAADDPAAAVQFPIEGFWGGSATRRSVQFG